MRSESYTKKGPGRVHVYGERRYLKPKADSLDAKTWKLNPTSLAERKRANEKRPKVITHG